MSDGVLKHEVHGVLDKFHILLDLTTVVKRSETPVKMKPPDIEAVLPSLLDKMNGIAM